MKDLVAGGAVRVRSILTRGLMVLIVSHGGGALWNCRAAQSDTETAKVPLRGTVIEAGTGLPAQGVEVQAAALEATNGVMLGSSRVTVGAPAVSDVNGRFEVLVDGPGQFELRAQGQGYGSPGPEMDGFEPSIRVEVKRGAKEVSGLSIEIARPAAFTGKVIDESTRAPLRGFSVFAAARSRRVMLDGELGGTSASSDAAGRFSLTNLTPAPYRIRVEPPAAMRPAIAEGEVELDDRPAAEGYCTTWWPGVDQRVQGGTQGLVSGQEIDLGSIPMARCRAYTVAVRVTGAGCAEGERMNVQLRPLDGRAGASSVVACGASIYVSRVIPGDYQLILSTSADGSRGRLRGLAAFTAIPKNMRLDVLLTGGDRVCGVVKPPESKKQDFDFGALRVRISAPGGLRFASDQAVGLDGEGRFCVDGVGPWENRIFVEGLTAGLYMKKIMYNGSPARKVWSPAPGALGHNLEIALAEGVARIEGTVMNGKVAVADARVFVARWPLEGASVREELRWIWTGADGRFAFDSIAPGDYRVFASPREAAAGWTPESVMAQLQVLKSIQVGDGESKSVAIGSLAY
jgi:hypothetical protein